MKIHFLLTFAFCLVLSVQAQTPGATYSSEQLDQLLGPIALYPDPLIAVILPAATAPADLTLAAKYLAANGAMDGIDAQSWDPSVKALAHYPEVIKWMSDNLDWTQSLGAAFAQQPADVMKSVQQLRVQARAAGTLVDTPQQRIDLEGDDIRIIPAQQDVIYVPEYDPTIVYEAPVGYAGPYVTFGVGFPVGLWLGYQVDWDDYGIWVGPWNRGWAYRREWRQPGAGGNSWRAWRPDPRRSREEVRSFYRPAGRLPSPAFTRSSRGPIRPSGVAPHPTISHAPSPRPDFRGRPIAAPRPARPAPSGNFVGGYNRGAQVREFSGRGQASRSAPVRAPSPPRATAPARAAQPARPAAPSRGSGPADDKSQRH
jgi:hypothetical protein